jgi:hypothetical protein
MIKYDEKGMIKYDVSIGNGGSGLLKSFAREEGAPIVPPAEIIKINKIFFFISKLIF